MARVILSSFPVPAVLTAPLFYQFHRETVRSVRKKTVRENYSAPAARNISFLIILFSLTSLAPCSIISQGGSEIREEENSERKPSRACGAQYLFPHLLFSLPSLAPCSIISQRGSENGEGKDNAGKRRRGNEPFSPA
jgi:hypothetical protein